MFELQSAISIRRQEAERFFSAAAFNWPDLALEQCGWLSPAVFSDVRYRTFWEKLLETRDPIIAAQAVDLMMIADLAADRSLEGIFFASDLRPFANRVASEKWAYDTAERLPLLAKALGDGEIDLAQGMTREMGTNSPQSVEHVPDISDAAQDFIKILHEDGHTIRTGIEKFDQAVGGLWRKTETIICARPSMGKTAISLQIATGCADYGAKVLIFSLEMIAREWWARLVCGAAEVSYRDMMAKRLSGTDIELIEQWHKSMLNRYAGKIMIDDRRHSSLDIWRKCASERPDVVIVDHIGLAADPMPKGLNEVKRLGIITQNLKDMAKELNCSVLGLSQLNRSLENRQDKHPTMADIRDSGEIEQNADFILGLHREKDLLDPKQRYSQADLEVLKFRNGPGSIMMRFQFDGLKQKFIE
jgi:replicative DNA helicase